MRENIDKDPVERYRAASDAERIDWDCIDFNGKSVSIKVSRISSLHICIFVE